MLDMNQNSRRATSQCFIKAQTSWEKAKLKVIVNIVSSDTVIRFEVWFTAPLSGVTAGILF
jgi:hypothetical protein